MSKKTQAIYNLIDNLSELNLQLQKITQSFSSHRELEDISFKMEQDLKTLRFWFDSIYAYNGKSTSIAKKNSSRENGKKGGRPPKRITLLKRRKTELSDIIIPELEHKIKLSDDNGTLEILKSELKKAQTELNEILLELENYSSNKN